MLRRRPPHSPSPPLPPAPPPCEGPVAAVALMLDEDDDDEEEDEDTEAAFVAEEDVAKGADPPTVALPAEEAGALAAVIVADADAAVEKAVARFVPPAPAPTEKEGDVTAAGGEEAGFMPAAWGGEEARCAPAAWGL
jgi:hypothetical protein